MKGELFSRFAAQAARHTGRSWSFVAALVLIVVWAVFGPFFHFSDTWESILFRYVGEHQESWGARDALQKRR